MKGCLAVLLACAFAVPARAQDPVQVDSAHYKVELENDCVRVLRIHYGPGERSVMHEHPDAVAVLLTPGQFRFSQPDGQVQDVQAQAGDATWSPASVHLPENTGSAPMEVVLVELKPGRGAVCERPQEAGGREAGGPQRAGGPQEAGGPQRAGPPEGCVGLGCGDSVPPCIGMGCPE
jgi:quercetin dioxygenase-like cupin family protein